MPAKNLTVIKVHVGRKMTAPLTLTNFGAISTGAFPRCLVAVEILATAGATDPARR
jgi:hypothetical protein